MDVIAEHLAHLRRRNHRPGTIAQKGYALRRLERWIVPTPVLAASIVELRSFTGRPTTGASAHANEVSHLRVFYRWALLEGLRVDDPTVRLERPSVPAGIPNPMPDEQVEYALANAPERINPWLHLAAYGGLRACEIGPVRGEHRLDGWLYLPEQKGGAAGVARIPKPLEQVVAMFPRRGWAFPHRGLGGSGPTSAGQVQRLANRWLHDNGITHTLHTLRHWYGTEFLRVTGNLEVVRKAMRHTSIQSTVRYTKVADSEVADGAAMLRDLTPGRLRVA